MFLREREVAKMLKVSVSTLQKWRGRGMGPPIYKVGKSVRYREDSLKEWLESIKVVKEVK